MSYGSWAPGAGKGCRKALPDCVYVVLPACTARGRRWYLSRSWVVCVCARMGPLRYARYALLCYARLGASDHATNDPERHSRSMGAYRCRHVL